jgi:hypothetical protein
MPLALLQTRRLPEFVGIKESLPIFYSSVQFNEMADMNSFIHDRPEERISEK